MSGSGSKALAADSMTFMLTSSEPIPIRAISSNSFSVSSSALPETSLLTLFLMSLIALGFTIPFATNVYRPPVQFFLIVTGLNIVAVSLRRESK